MTGRADRLVGCLLAGAVGDALGAGIEFLDFDEIRRRHGPDGVTGMTEAYGRRGAITDDTQMTLFTAEGVIRARLRGQTKGITDLAGVVHHAYLRWLHTQGESSSAPIGAHPPDGGLITHRDLFARRAPGTTCLTALRGPAPGRLGAAPLNDSKGCGGVMRAAPAAVWPGEPFRAGCEVAAITHGHPSGYLAAGVLAATIAALLDGRSLDTALDDADARLRREPGREEVAHALEHARHTAARGEATAETVESLGQGWVAEEALAIAVFCALVATDVRHGLLLAVNHGGDSDSTGAIAGNLLGAMHGPGAIPEEWLAELELRDVIEQLARDLADDSDPGEGYPPW